MQSPPDHSDAFYIRWLAMCHRLDVSPIHLMRVAYSESNARPNAHNPFGNAVGLIQFMPQTLTGLGWTMGWEAFSKLAAEDQVPFVERYFRPWAHRIGLGGQSIPQLTTDALCYVATFLPACLAGAALTDDGYILCGRDGPLAWAYRSNTVLDRDGDGKITVADLGRQLDRQCRGARYDAIVHRLAVAAGHPSTPPEPAPTEPEIACDDEPDDAA